MYALKYVFIWLAQALRLRPRTYDRPHLLRLFAEDMGPTFIKFGQIVASSSGMFPKRYVTEFQKCLDRVRPFSFDLVEKIVADELGEDARRIASIEAKQLASASIAQ